MVEIVLVADPALSANVLSDAEIAEAARGLQDWVNSGPGRAWSQGCYKVSWVPRGKPAPAGTDHRWLVWLMTNSDVRGAAGYHTVGAAADRPGPVAAPKPLAGQPGVAGNAPIARIFVVDIFAYGMSWTAVASHEIAEMMVNRWVDLGIMGTFAGGFGCYTRMARIAISCPYAGPGEACDPCERFGAVHGYGDGKSIVVSDVCTPAYFRPGAPGPYSLYGHCPAPLTPAPGGRQLVASLGQAHDVTVVPFGEGAEPREGTEPAEGAEPRARTRRGDERLGAEPRAPTKAVPRISSACERA